MNSNSQISIDNKICSLKLKLNTQGMISIYISLFEV